MLPDKPLQTFISYSRVNQQFAIRLACELKSAGFCVWMDQFDIPTGARWDDEIEKALRESQIFLFIMTPASTASENAKDEMGYAIDHGKHILPVLLEPCEVPLRLRRMQYVDFTRMSFDQGIKKAKELLFELINEIEKSGPETSKHAGVIHAEKEPILSVKEPKTVPTGAGHAPYIVPTRLRRPERRVSKQIFLGIGILLIGAVFVASLMFKPSFFAPPPTSSPTSTAVPTETVVVTDTFVSTSPPIKETPQISRSFTEDFSSDSQWKTDWNLQFRHGSAKKQDSFQYAITDGEMVLDLVYKFVWGYFLYQPLYNHVELEAVVADLNYVDTVGLICQFSDQGWYEFDINGGGTFYVRYVDNME
jgi:hypothetical protein